MLYYSFSASYDSLIFFLQNNQKRQSVCQVQNNRHENMQANRCGLNEICRFYPAKYPLPLHLQLLQGTGHGFQDA